MKSIKLALPPTDRILKVYFGNDREFLKLEYPKADAHSYEHDGIYFANYNRVNEFYDVIVIDNVAETWKKCAWYNKVSLIAHEISHCVFDIMRQSGIKDDEFQAYYIQYLLDEICEKFDWDKNKIKKKFAYKD